MGGAMGQNRQAKDGSGPVRVLIIDDSALVRKLLRDILSSDPGIEVVGAAPDPIIARQKIKALDPHVLTLDVEMPRMDGLTFLRNLMRLRPMPVVMISSLTERGAEITLEALSIGAVDFVAKPKLDLAQGLAEYRELILEKIRAAAHAKVRAIDPSSEQKNPAAKSSASATPRSFRMTDTIIAIGASTGGTEAISDVVREFPADAPAVVITQHIPERFSASFARRLDEHSAMKVQEARDGDQIVAGHVYIAPGDFHMRIERSGARYCCRLDQGELVNRHRPSVDVMFDSVAQNVGRNAIGVILTGMGRDGANGLLAMKQAGAPTIAQDQATSVVWGMPGSAVEVGAVDQIFSLNKIAGAVMDTVSALDGHGTEHGRR